MQSVVFGCIALVLAASRLRAQATLRGSVRAERGDPIAGADVLVGGTSLRSQTGGDGKFAIRNIPAGKYIVSVRAVGFQPLEAEAELIGTDTIEVTFELKRSVQVLESLRVEAPAPKPVSAKMVAFEERRKAGFGRFLTREILEKRENSALSDVLRMVAGFNLVRRPYECGGGYAGATGRGGMIKWEPWMLCSGHMMQPACFMSIYLDGSRIWIWGQEEIPDLDKLTSVITLDGIEIYRGPSETPIAYQSTGSACGVILLWTRD